MRRKRCTTELAFNKDMVTNRMEKKLREAKSGRNAQYDNRIK